MYTRSSVLNKSFSKSTSFPRSRGKLKTFPAISISYPVFSSPTRLGRFILSTIFIRARRLFSERYKQSCNPVTIVLWYSRYFACSRRFLATLNIIRKYGSSLSRTRKCDLFIGHYDATARTSEKALSSHSKQKHFFIECRLDSVRTSLPYIKKFFRTVYTTR